MITIGGEEFGDDVWDALLAVVAERDAARAEYAKAERRGRQAAAEAILAHAEKHAPGDGNEAQRRLRRHLGIAARVAAGPMTHDEVAKALRELHPETYCHRCGDPNVSWAAPSPLWNAVMRGGDINGVDLHDGIVCMACFAELAEAAQVATSWRLVAETVYAELQTVTPSGRVWDEQTWLWKETDR